MALNVLMYGTDGTVDNC